MPPNMNVDDLLEYFLSELNKSEGWDLMGETENCKLYRKSYDDTEIMEFKLHSTIDNVTLELYQEFHENFECRKNWDENVVEFYKVPENGHVFLETKHAWPLWNREHVFKNDKREMMIDGQPCYLTISYSVESENPPKPSVVRCPDFWGIAIIFENPEKENSVKTLYHCYDKPGFSIYNWLIEWSAQSEMEKSYNAMISELKAYISRRCTTAEKEENQDDSTTVN